MPKKSPKKFYVDTNTGFSIAEDDDLESYLYRQEVTQKTWINRRPCDPKSGWIVWYRKETLPKAIENKHVIYYMNFQKKEYYIDNKTKYSIPDKFSDLYPDKKIVCSYNYSQHKAVNINTGEPLELTPAELNKAIKDGTICEKRKWKASASGQQQIEKNKPLSSLPQLNYSPHFFDTMAVKKITEDMELPLYELAPNNYNPNP